MHNSFSDIFLKGVIYHAFSDHSGVTIYSTFSNEVFVTSVQYDELINSICSRDVNNEQQRSLKAELIKKGFIKSEWH